MTQPFSHVPSDSWWPMEVAETVLTSHTKSRWRSILCCNVTSVSVDLLLLSSTPPPSHLSGALGVILWWHGIFLLNNWQWRILGRAGRV